MTIRRLSWLIIILLSLAVYFPINRLASGGWALFLPIDKLIPLYPQALIPYLFGSLLFLSFPIYAAIYSRKTEFEAYVISFITATFISYIIYIAFPTYVIRPEITSQEYFHRAIILLYHNDFPHNATPSGHTFYTIITLLYINRWKPKLQIISFSIAFLIIASTLFTKQHYLLDILTGLILGFLAFLIGRYIQSKYNLKFAS